MQNWVMQRRQPILSVVLRGHLCSSSSLIMGALHTASAWFSGVCCIHLSFTRTAAPRKSNLSVSRFDFDLDTQKRRAVRPAPSYAKQKKKKRKKRKCQYREWYDIWPVDEGLEGALLLTFRIDIRTSSGQSFHHQLPHLSH